ncbi:MAG: dephospho-CoA kinase, partial [Clostridiales Family XIII bacterium]|nr:dephospho-CoA kinase [Clostridiales Family XIII bacterium]
LIVADEDVRIRRAASRDGLTEAEIRVRATRQMSDSEKRKRADVVIENDGDEKALLAKIDRLLE